VSIKYLPGYNECILKPNFLFVDAAPLVDRSDIAALATGVTNSLIHYTTVIYDVTT